MNNFQAEEHGTEERLELRIDSNLSVIAAHTMLSTVVACHAGDTPITY